MLAAVGFGAPPFPAPTITSSPPNPSSSRSASFTYTDSQAITRFECSLDGAAFAACGTARPSSKSYGGLADGPHTFRVRAVSGSTTSAATSYAWVIDTTAPTVVSINRAGASPTNVAAVAWTVTFSEGVAGVTSGNFGLSATGLIGTPAVTAVTGSGAVYTVTASTGTGTTGATGTLALRLTSAGAITDAAGNGLKVVQFSGQAYTIDKTPPPAPSITSGPRQLPFASASTQASFGFTDSEVGVAFLCRLDGAAVAVCSSPKTYNGLAQGSHTFRLQARDAAGNLSLPASWTFVVDTVAPSKPTLTQTPTDPTVSQSATFAWVDADSGSGVAADACKLDNGSVQLCSSPKTLTNLALGSHTFSVTAVDFAGNPSPAATFTWTITQQGLPFAIAGSASDLLYPGAPFTPIALTITNPNPLPIFVTGLTVTVTNDPNGCTNATNVEVQPSPASPTNELTVPASTTNWPVPASFQPKIRLKDTGANQDACQSQTFSLSYTGSAHS